MNSKFRVFLVSSFISLILWVIIRLSYQAEVHTVIRARIVANNDRFNGYNIDTVFNVTLQGRGMDLFRFYFTRPDTFFISGDKLPIRNVEDTALITINKNQVQSLFNSVLLPYKLKTGSILSDSMVFRRLAYPVREIPVKIAMAGRLPDDVRIIGRPIVSPSRVKVIMSYDHFKLIDTIKTETINLTGANDTIRRTIGLRFFPDKGDALVQKTVFVLIPIAKMEEREFDISYSPGGRIPAIDVKIRAAIPGSKTLQEARKEIKISHLVVNDSVRLSVSGPQYISIISYEPHSIPFE